MSEQFMCMAFLKNIMLAVSLVMRNCLVFPLTKISLNDCNFIPVSYILVGNVYNPKQKVELPKWLRISGELSLFSI